MPKDPARLAASALIAVTLAVRPDAHADDILYQYEGDVLPWDESAGWRIFQECSEDKCVPSIQQGHLMIGWTEKDHVNYHLTLARIDEPQPPTLWVEWSFRSNQQFGGIFDGCDAAFNFQYKGIADLVNMFGDAAISFGGDTVLGGLDPAVFHTYRLQSSDGVQYAINVDGVAFIDRLDVKDITSAYLQMWGAGGCGDQLPTINEWDFVRYGTISHGERIVAADQPVGFLRAEDFPALDRITVRFEEPNYVYVDEIGIESFDADGNRRQGTGDSGPPTVVATHRLDNGPPDVVEVVLDKPIPLDARTVFTFDDGTVRQTVAYTYIQGDANADGRFDLRDAAEFQNCFGDRLESWSHKGCCRCWAFDFDGNGYISFEDYAAFQPLLAPVP